MQPFLLIASAHFLSLLSPGPDFFLIIRLALASGWRVASGACVGISLANAFFITAAFAGTALLRTDSTSFAVLQAAGAAYLLYLGALFIRHAGTTVLDDDSAGAEGKAGDTDGKASTARGRHMAARGWWQAAGMGFLSGILNPKNALFYASLAALLPATHATVGWKTAYGLWMFSIVLLWDLLVAALIGNHLVLRRLARAVPWLERVSGAMLVLLALGIVATLVLRA